MKTYRKYILSTEVNKIYHLYFTRGSIKKNLSVNKQCPEVKYILVTVKEKLVNGKRKQTTIHFTTVDTISACGNSFLAKIYFVLKLLFELIHRPLMSVLLVDWLIDCCLMIRQKYVCRVHDFGVCLVKFSLIIIRRCLIKRMNFPTYNDLRVLLEAKIIKWSYSKMYYGMYSLRKVQKLTYLLPRNKLQLTDYLP